MLAAFTVANASTDVWAKSWRGTDLQMRRHYSITSDFRSCGVSILVLALERLINGLRPVRSLIANCHQTEGIGSVTRKIVFRAKSDMPLLVFLLMVIAQA